MTTFSSASGMTIPAGTEKVFTSGYYSSGTGGGTYIFELDVDSSFVSANPLWSFIDSNGNGWRLFPEHGILPLDAFGADPTVKQATATSAELSDAAAKNVAAFEAAKACAAYYRINQVGSDGEAGTRANLWYFGTPVIQAGLGTYWFGGTNLLVAEGQVVLRGFGSGSTNNNGSATRFQWDGTCNGLTFHSDTSYDGPEQVATNATSSNSVVEGILFDGGGGPLTNDFSAGSLTNFNIGVWLRADGIRIRSCGFDNWSGCGVVVGARPGQADTHSANLDWVDHCNFTLCGFAGLYFHGGDSNAGGGNANSFIYCGRYGCYDSSFLANAHSGYHARGIGWGQVAGTRDHSISTIGYPFVRHNGYYWACVPGQETIASTTEPGTDPTIWAPFGVDDSVSSYAEAWTSGHTYVSAVAYRANDPNANSVFIGCYNEDDTPGFYFDGPGLALGGDNTTLVQSQQGAVATVQNGNVVNVTGGWGFQEKRYNSSSNYGAVPAATVTAHFGGNAANKDILYYQDSQFWPIAVRIRQGDSEGALSLDYGNDLTTAGWIYTGPSTTYHFGRGTTQPYSLILGHAFFGNGDAARSITCASTDPALGSGVHGAGDIVFNNAPTAGGKAGWICVTAGTPGTWKEFGAIDT